MSFWDNLQNNGSSGSNTPIKPPTPIGTPIPTTPSISTPPSQQTNPITQNKGSFWDKVVPQETQPTSFWDKVVKPVESDNNKLLQTKPANIDITGRPIVKTTKPSLIDLLNQHIEIGPAKQPTQFDSIRNSIKELLNLNEDPQRDAVVMTLSKNTGQSPDVIDKNLSDYTKALKLRSTPTTRELVDNLFTLPVVAGFISNPITTTLGIAGWEAMSTVEKKITGGKELSDVISDNLNLGEGARTALYLAEIFAKGKVLHSIYKQAPDIANTFIKDITTTYSIPKEVTVDANSISDYISGRKITNNEAIDFYKTLGRTPEQIRSDVKNGVTISLPIEKLVTIADKPYWSKIKGLFGVKPSETKVISKDTVPMQEKLKQLPGYVPENPSPIKAGLSVEKVKPVGFAEKPTPYKETGNLTTTILKDLEGKSTISKQYILDATNRSNIKQVEKDIILNALKDEGTTIDVPKFAEKVKSELLPLKIKDLQETKTQILENIKKEGYDIEYDMGDSVYIRDKEGNEVEYDDLPNNVRKLYDEWAGNAETYEGAMGNRYKNVSLPSELKGNVINYKEHIYESPIKTSAGSIHQFDTKNYFGHTRLEDIAGDKIPTRRVIEVQSDLYQKGNLEDEVKNRLNAEGKIDPRSYIEMMKNNGYDAKQIADWEKKIPEYDKAVEKAKLEVSKLQQYSDPSAHFRIVREEIKKASQDGVKKLQFPTGETAMKIEGLSREDFWYDTEAFNKVKEAGPVEGMGGIQLLNRDARLDPSKLKVTQSITDNRGEEWIITDVLGDGKFKAVPKDRVGMAFENGGGGLNALQSDARGNMRPLSDWQETFDISGKVDTNNPIYKFYESTLGKYLKNNYNAKLITDSRGVSWYELDITPEQGKKPVVAFKKPQISKLEGPRISVEEAKKIIFENIPEKDVKLIFTNELIDGNALGEYDPTGIKEFKGMKPVLKPLIRLYQEGGTVSAITAYHEAGHYIFDNFLSETDKREVLDIAHKEMSLIRKGTYRMFGYRGKDVVAEEYIMDEYARQKAKEAGFHGPFKEFFDKLETIIKKIIDTYKKVVDKIKSLIPKEGRQGGYVRIGKKGAPEEYDAFYKNKKPTTDIETIREKNRNIEKAFEEVIKNPSDSLDTLSYIENKYNLSKEESNRVVKESNFGVGKQAKIVETGVPAPSKTPFSANKREESIPSEYREYADTLKKIKAGDVENRIARYQIADLPEEFGNKGNRTDLRITYHVVDKVAGSKIGHGSFPIYEFLKTTNEPDGIITFPVNDKGIESINIVKKLDNELYVVGAVRVNGYNVVTFFEPKTSDKQKYLAKAKADGGTLAYDSGGSQSLFATFQNQGLEVSRNPQMSLKDQNHIDSNKISNDVEEVNSKSVYNLKHPQYVNPIETKIQSLVDESSFLEETIKNNPARHLQRYANKNGELPEVLGHGKSIFARKGDDIVLNKLGYEDSETARNEFQNFKLQQKRLQSYKEEIKKLKDVYYNNKSIEKDAQKLSSLLEKSYQKTGKEIAKIAAKYNEKPVETRQAMMARQKKAQENMHALMDAVYKTTSPLEKETPLHMLNLSQEAYNMTLSEFEKMNEDNSFTKLLTGKYQTPLSKKIGIIDLLRTPDRVLIKIGLPRLASLLRHSYENYLNELPVHIDLIKSWKNRVDPKSNKDIFRYLDGQDTRDYYAGKIRTRLTPNELKVANEIKAYLKEWADRLGLPEDQKIGHYITHLFSFKQNEIEFDEDLAKIITDKAPESIYDPFLQERLGKKGYKEDTWAALDAYVKRAVRKANMDPVLERLAEESKVLELSQQKYVTRLAERINMRPTEIDNAIDTTIKSLVGYRLGQRPVAYISRLARQMVFRSTLGGNIGSAIKNLTQGVNTFAKLGSKYTLIGYTKLMTQGAKELEELGILNQDIVQDRTLSATKQVLEKLDKGLFYLFDTAEKINRGAAFYGARAKALAEGKTELEAFEYAKKVVRDTQFVFGSIDTPLGMNSDIAKVFTQFMTYGVKQTEFATEMIQNKEWAGIFRYITASAAIVYLFGKIFNIKSSDFIPGYSFLRFGTPPSLALPSEILKAVFDVPDKFGNQRTLKQKGEDILDTVPFPASVQAKKTYKGIEALSTDKSANKIEKNAYNVTKALLLGPTNINNRKNLIQDVYDKVKLLKSTGNNDTAKKIVDSLSEEDYTIYKDILDKDNTTRIKEVYTKVQQLKTQGKNEEAKKIVDDLSDSDYKVYKNIYEKNKDKEKPEYSTGTKLNEDGLLKKIATYAKAIGTDPETAFNRIFTGQYIRRVDNGTIIVERMPLLSSLKIKKQRNATSDLRLDHTIPLEIGGSNAESNLKLVPKEIWSSYTPVENYLAKLLKSGKITKSEAQELITSFKNGEKTASEILKIK